jgi:acetyl-CoA acetyltransferase
MPQFHYVTEFEHPIGNSAPAQIYAPMAQRHMALYGTKVSHFGEVAVAHRQHALLNANAVMKKPMTLEEHANSRMISEPFRLFDCSLESDGGAACIVSSANSAADLKHRRIFISGVAAGHPDQPGAITQRPDMTSLGIAKAAARAFQMAGVTPADIDVAEIYDCFTYAVIRQLEDLGFCKKGEGGPFVEGGRLRLDGALPTNTHGGLLSQAHVWGLNHIVELVRQLRGEAGAQSATQHQAGPRAHALSLPLPAPLSVSLSLPLGGSDGGKALSRRHSSHPKGTTSSKTQPLARTPWRNTIGSGQGSSATGPMTTRKRPVPSSKRSTTA